MIISSLSVNNFESSDKLFAGMITFALIFANFKGLFARAMLHEMDHLDGILYVDKVEGEIEDIEAEE